jgi:3'(2'), 5'-bisphosphate nucleotidase
MSDALLDQCLVHALVAAKKAGEAILTVYQGEFAIDYKEDESPLTLADKRAHRIIQGCLTAEPLSRIGVLSEEGRHIPYEERERWEHLWVVDPLDGTKEFIKRRGEFTVNIALIQQNRPILGVVLLPVKGLVYFAAEGIGSYKLEELEMIERLHHGEEGFPQNALPLHRVVAASKPLPLHDSTPNTRGKLTIVGSRSHATETLTDFVGTMRQRYGEVDFTPAGSSLKFCRVAEGSADLYPRYGPTMEWDTAAGHCVVEQSGGLVLQVEGRIPLQYNKKDLYNPHFICIGKHSRDLRL